MKELDKLKELGIDNPYLRLGIRESASDEEILSSFRETVKLYGDTPDRKVDNQYVMEILMAIKDALMNSEARKVIDESIASRKANHAIQTRVKDKGSTSEEMLKNSSLSTGEKKKIRTDALLPELLEEIGITQQEELSFADIQLLLKEYLKNSWGKPSRSEDIKNRNLYLLLDKKGHLSAVKTSVLPRIMTSDIAVLEDLYTKQHVYESAGDLTVSGWNRIIPDDECLVSLGSIFPEAVVNRSFISSSDFIKGLELGNECLLQLKKSGYLKKPSAKEYIR